MNEPTCISGVLCETTSNCHCDNCKKYWAAIAAEDKLAESYDVIDAIYRLENETDE